MFSLSVRCLFNRLHDSVKEVSLLRLSCVPYVRQDPPRPAELVPDGDNAVVRDRAGDIMFELEGILDGKEVTVPDFSLLCTLVVYLAHMQSEPFIHCLLP